MAMAYLDIETSFDQRITIVGIWRDGSGQQTLAGPGEGMIQLVGPRVTADAIVAALTDVDVLHTYNGHRFDLPVIKGELGLDLRRRFACRDLMHDCWRHKLKGGFKGVERQLGITRETAGVDGWQAMQLWAKYLEHDDQDALDLLLAYNREDCVNLAKVREILDARLTGPSLTT